MSCDNTDDEIKVTKEYKHLLSNIRPLIDQLVKPRDAQLCLLWLSKLEQSGRWERKYRNQILSELCKQVKANCLKSPFSSPPPSGPLQNVFLGLCRVWDWNNQNYFSDGDASTEPELSSSSPHSSLSKNHASTLSWRENHFYSNFKNKKLIKPDKEEADHSECFAIQKAYHERAQSDQMVIEKYQDIIKSLVSQQLKADISPSKLKKLQTTYESKVAELLSSLEKVQAENELLKREIEAATHDINKICVLKNENEDLKKKVISLMASRDSFEIKFNECREEKLKECTDLMDKLNESDKKLKESEKRLKSLEKQYQENCETGYLTQVDAEKNFTGEVKNLEKQIEHKNSEIVKLKQQIISQASHFEEEICRLKQELVLNDSFTKDKKKIKVLKSKARKSEKMREHMAVLFHSQLQQIIAKKDFYIATLEMQLKLHKSESGENNSGADLHNTLVQKVSLLEEQYRKLLEDAEKQSIKRRQLDLQKIHNLEKQLLLCGGVLENADSNLDCLKTKSLISVTAIDDESGDKIS